MLRTILNMFRIKELRNRIFFTLGLLAVYRIGAYIPTPGINPDKLKTFFGSASTSGLMNMMDLFTGGAMRNVTILALGIMPYISASIILQLMTSVVPTLEKLSHEGEAGRKKINQYTRYGTVAVCIIQALMLSNQLVKGGVNLIPAPFFNIIVIITLTAGTIWLMWIGEQITSRGIGNGISLIIMAGIVSRMPVAARMLWKLYGIGAAESRPFWHVILLATMFVAVVAGVIYVIQGQRRIPVQYAKRVAGGRTFGGQSTYIPLRVNQAGVIPIIFASAILMLPAALAKIVPESLPMLRDFFGLFARGGLVYLLAFAVCIIFFCFFYTAITFNPVQIADDFKKGGAFVPGVRPGKPTADFLEFTMVRLTVAGSIFLAVIAVTPMIISTWLGINYMIASFLGGTGLLITVGVMLDTMQQVEAHLLMRHYDGFMKDGKLKGRY